MPSELILTSFVLLGLISGLLGGLLGIGGGVITVPVLYFIFQYTGMFEERIMQVAASTSLAAGVITSAISTFAQWRKRAIQFSVFRLIVPGLFIGCIIGSVGSHYMSSLLLTQIFGVVAIFLGLYFLFPRLPSPYIYSKPNKTLSFFGFWIGVISSMLGIGGGAFTFPVLLGYQVSAKHSSATSSIATLVTTFFGTIGYLLIAWHNPKLPYTFGYIEIPAFLAISIGSILTSPLGVYLSHVLNVALIKQILGGCLALIGFTLLIPTARFLF